MTIGMRERETGGASCSPTGLRVWLPVPRRDEIEVRPVHALAGMSGRLEHFRAARRQPEPTLEPLRDPTVRPGAEGHAAPTGEDLELIADGGNVGGRDPEGGADRGVARAGRRRECRRNGQAVGEHERGARSHPLDRGGTRWPSGRNREASDEQRVDGRRDGCRKHPAGVDAVLNAVRWPGGLAGDQRLHDILRWRVREAPRRLPIASHRTSARPG